MFAVNRVREIDRFQWARDARLSHNERLEVGCPKPIRRLRHGTKRGASPSPLTLPPHTCNMASAATIMKAQGGRRRKLEGEEGLSAQPPSQILPRTLGDFSLCPVVQKSGTLSCKEDWEVTLVGGWGKHVAILNPNTLPTGGSVKRGHGHLTGGG